MNDKEAQEEKQLLKDERIAAKQIKNSFADIERIEFDKNSVRKHAIPGDTTILVKIKTKNDRYDLELSLPTNSDSKILEAYLGNAGKEGETTSKVDVIYSNDHKESIE